MKKLIFMVLIGGFVAKTNCVLTEKLSAASSKIATVRAGVKTGDLTIKINTCGEGSGNCKNGCTKA